MIFTMIINEFLDIIMGLINLLPSIPATGLFNSQALADATDYVFASLGLIDIIVPISLLQTIVAGMITLALFKLVWSIIMFILKKVPLASID